MIVIKKSLVPPGGWQYREKSTDYLIVAPNYDELFNLIEDHRLANGLDLSSGWEQRVVDELCETLPPTFCLDEDAPLPERKTSLRDVKNFMRTVTKWAMSDATYATEEEAERRAAICATCPMNIAVSGCRGAG